MTRKRKAERGRRTEGGRGGEFGEGGRVKANVILLQSSQQSYLLCKGAGYKNHLSMVNSKSQSKFHLRKSVF